MVGIHSRIGFIIQEDDKSPGSSGLPCANEANKWQVLCLSAGWTFNNLRMAKCNGGRNSCSTLTGHAPLDSWMEM